MKKLVLCIFLLSVLIPSISKSIEDWNLVFNVPSFQSENELYPESTVYIDINSIIIKDSEVTSFNYKQVYSKPLSSGIKTFISSIEINCIRNQYKFISYIGYDSNNNVIAKEAVKQGFTRIDGKTAVAASRDYACMYQSK